MDQTIPECLKDFVAMVISRATRNPLTSSRLGQNAGMSRNVRKRRIEGMRTSDWRCHLDEIFPKINGVSATCGGL
jgi:hypothetical protein